MGKYDEFYEARNIIGELLYKDFVGPVAEQEILAELPGQYYIMGKLYPQQDSEKAVNLANASIMDNEADMYDASISLSNQRNPASFGVTCLLKPGVREIVVQGSYAFYKPITASEAAQAGVDIAKYTNESKKQLDFWQRQPYSYCKQVNIAPARKVEFFSLEHGLRLQLYTHDVLSSGARLITAVLYNANVSKGYDDVGGKSALCAFQTSLKIASADNSCIFEDVNCQENISCDREVQELAMLYDDIHCYAQGHGCATVWDREQPEPAWVSSEWLPSYNLHQMMAASIRDSQALSMQFLAYGQPDEVLAKLEGFINAYQVWIDGLQERVVSLKQEYRETAENNLAKCRAAERRMMEAVTLLRNSVSGDNKAMQAFQWANEAMFMQRQRTLIKAGRSVEGQSINWYPFQLAFILHELSSFIQPEGMARKMVDLLWFPTGGGKTEAYLGITAFVIFLRRLKNCQENGVTVLMRYTLRLLTLQQFERASMLICACELLRQKYKLGGEEISIGLWVGGKLTPNRLEEANAIIRKQKQGDFAGTDIANPCQIKVCPWCGRKLTVNNYAVDLEGQRMVIACTGDDCEFSKIATGLPLHIVDEAIYRYLPDFVVATVDKFAQIPLSGKPANLFGIGRGKKPPELIIQDELHLISGPLGTMAGIYEAAITKLCECSGIPAKVIASTATIRNAGKQIMALYGREYAQFPPQGISARDAYFAVEATETDKPARMYYGVMGVGTTATTTLIRTNAVLLFASRYLVACGFSDAVVDNFWTLVGYFNSLRELGGTSTQILDDVQSRFLYLAKTKFAHIAKNVDTAVPYDNLIELTSRMNNEEITTIIQDRLKRAYRQGKHKDVYDFVLASNMISVGVDVGRLGAMIVAGQPKTNAEYIQATSRVGRDNPGLVAMVYNGGRSRDRSHYEQFLKYHSALYRYVEAVSLTPFADRARDRGLHALYVSLCRYLVKDMLPNEAACHYDSSRHEIKNIRQWILAYVQAIDPAEVAAVDRELADISEQWEDMAVGDLVYKDYFHKSVRQLLQASMEDDRFRTMNSLRSVDAQAGIYLLGR